MEIFAMLLVIVGFIAFLIGGIWFLVESFRESIWWGLGVMFVPFVEIVFLIAHWRIASKPFGLQLAGMALLFIGSLISESGMPAGI